MATNTLLPIFPLGKSFVVNFCHTVIYFRYIMLHNLCTVNAIINM